MLRRCGAALSVRGPEPPCPVSRGLHRRGRQATTRNVDMLGAHAMAQFMFATGIENSYPTIEWRGRTIRQDEFAKTRHYECWREDFEILQELGIGHLRYGPPYFSTHLG